MSVEQIKNDLSDGKMDTLRTFLSNEGDPNIADEEWNCPLMFYAILGGSIEALKLLVESGANVNLHAGEPGCDILADTPLGLAKQTHFLNDAESFNPIIKYLESRGARDEI